MKFNSSLTKAAMALNPADYIQLSNLGVSRDQASEVDKRSIHVPSLIKLLQGGHDFHDLLSEHDKGTDLKDIVGSEPKEQPMINAPEVTRNDLKELQADNFAAEEEDRKNHVDTLKVFANLLKHGGKSIDHSEVSFPEVVGKDTGYSFDDAKLIPTEMQVAGPNGGSTTTQLRFPSITSAEDSYMRGWMDKNSNLTLDDLSDIIAHNEKAPAGRKVSFDSLWSSRQEGADSEAVDRRRRMIRSKFSLPSDKELAEKKINISDLFPSKFTPEGGLDNDYEMNIRQPLLSMIGDIKKDKKGTLPFMEESATPSEVLLEFKKQILSHPDYRPMSSDVNVGKNGSKLSFKNPGRMIFNANSDYHFDDDEDVDTDDMIEPGLFGGDTYGHGGEVNEIPMSQLGESDTFNLEKTNFDDVNNWNPDDEGATYNSGDQSESFGLEDPEEIERASNTSEENFEEEAGSPEIGKVPCPFCDGKEDAIFPKPGSEYHDRPCLCGNSGEVCPTCSNFKPHIPAEALKPQDDDTKEMAASKQALAAVGNNSCPTCGRGVSPIQDVIGAARIPSGGNTSDLFRKVKHLQAGLNASDFESTLKPYDQISSDASYDDDLDDIFGSGKKTVALEPEDDEDESPYEEVLLYNYVFGKHFLPSPVCYG